jgi:protein-S-isoprenylcysteine O-methyltransferase Ste14
MPLKEEMEKQGQWLFRWRSYLPLLLLPFLVLALINSGNVERGFGEAAGTVWAAFSILVSLLGLVIRCLTIGYAQKGTSGRNRQEQKADALNTTGMYSIVRHPLYLGNFFVMLGFVLFVEVWWFVIIAGLAFWLYYERIMITEERFLLAQFGDRYLEWANRTPAFLPKFANWQKPDLSFSYKKMLRKEDSTLLMIVLSFVFLGIAGDVLSGRRVDFGPVWITLIAIGIGISLMLRIIRKNTRLLVTEDR